MIKMLMSVEQSLDYFLETHVADDKRVDIVIQANGTIILPIDIKRQWHSKLWTAADQ